MFYGLTKLDIENIDTEKLINVLVQHGFVLDKSMQRDKNKPLCVRDEVIEYEKQYRCCVIRMCFDYGKLKVGNGSWTGVQPYVLIQTKNLPELKRACLELESIFKEDIFKENINITYYVDILSCGKVLKTIVCNTSEEVERAISRHRNTFLAEEIKVYKDKKTLLKDINCKDEPKESWHRE